MKIVAAVVAVALMLLFLLPYVIKMSDDYALGAVILVGLGMMLVDLWQSLQSKDD
jgi:hypothetical protein